MGDALNLLLVLACILFPFIAMPLLWRRMKRVRRHSYERREPLPTAAPWRVSNGRNDGLSLDRAHDPNEDLIALGDRERHARWSLDNHRGGGAHAHRHPDLIRDPASSFWPSNSGNAAAKPRRRSSPERRRPAPP